MVFKATKEATKKTFSLKCQLQFYLIFRRKVALLIKSNLARVTADAAEPGFLTAPANIFKLALLLQGRSLVRVWIAFGSLGEFGNVMHLFSHN